MEGDPYLWQADHDHWISIHSLRMEGDAGALSHHHYGGISIHSLRMEGDRNRRNPSWTHLHFNPLPPHGGRRIFDTQRVQLVCISIHSLRMEGDSTPDCIVVSAEHFNPLPPHGGRLSFGISIPCSAYFNPLPPHGGRPSNPVTPTGRWVFQSTPSAWRETDTESVSAKSF